MKKATKELLLERATKNAEGSKYRDYPCEFIGMTLTVKRLPLAQVCGMFDALGNAATADSLELYKELIYKSVPLFKDEDLLREYNCVEPYDIVTAVFDDNLGEMTKIVNFILEFYGLDGIEDDVKN